ncbi:unnamed protein product [Sympodiomycopsis kandeliae]
MSSKGPVAFVGMGSMGLGMAQNLAKKGFAVSGFDLRPEAVQQLVDVGGHAATSAADAAKDKPLLVIMTINDVQARTILFKAGALEALGQNAIVLLTSTISPQAAEQISEEIKAVRPDVGFVDAPVSGGTPGASTGTLTMMAGGSKENFAKVEPALNAMGTKIFHVGEKPGQGQSMKVINQVLCGVHLAAAAEALSLAKATGIDPAIALELVKGSAAGSWMLSNRAHRMLEDEPQCFSAVQTWAKDFGIIMETGRTTGAALPLSAATANIFYSAMGRGQAEVDDTTIIRQYDFLNGNDVRGQQQQQQQQQKKQ